MVHPPSNHNIWLEEEMNGERGRGDRDSSKQVMVPEGKANTTDSKAAARQLAFGNPEALC
jgi:hypothetical protein